MKTCNAQSYSNANLTSDDAFCWDQRYPPLFYIILPTPLIRTMKLTPEQRGKN